MYDFYELALYLLIYSFLGWAAEAGYYAVSRRRFCNRGVVALPLVLSYGFTFVLLILLLPTLAGRPVLSFLATMVVSSVVERIGDYFFQRVGPKIRWNQERSRLLSGTGKGLLSSALVAGVYYLTYFIIHPFLLAGLMLVPELLRQLVVIVCFVLTALDFAAVFYAVRTGDASRYEERLAGSGQGRLAGRIYNSVWKRLQRAYPGLEAGPGQDEGSYTFAKGLCWDKLAWVFLISALLGDIIETFWCGLVDGEWMNRSSVLYGPFSFVWGLGAVVLTVTLQGLAEKSDRYIFLAGFLVGGAYEYLCSVFTELVFGTVFWDYSEIPFNLGGRINLLYCFFWGIAAVVWFKCCYPFISRMIEKLPVILGKVSTWALILFMCCNITVSCMALARYGERQEGMAAASGWQTWTDAHFPDERVERIYPNAIRVE